MTQATKRPWQARGNYLQVGNTHEDILICKCFDNAIANAAFIQKAVNCHDGLVEALESILITPILVTDNEKLDGTHIVSFTISMKTLKEAKKVLSKAESEA